MDELTGVFVQESREQLAEMEAGLLALEANPEETSDINAIFRAAHTIKGGAGVVECSYLESFTHKVENLLDQLRDGRLSPSEMRINLLLDCADHIGLLLDALEQGETTLSTSVIDADTRLRERLEQESAPSVASASPASPPPEAVAPVGENAPDIWYISVRFGEDVLRHGMDPIAFLRFLTTLGDIRELQTLADTMPPAEQMDPEACYLGFEICLETSAGKPEIEAVFDFVRDECELHILPPHSRSEDYIALINALPDDERPLLGEMLLRAGALTESELLIGLNSQELAKAYTDNSPPIGAILVEHKSVRPEVVEAAIQRQSAIQQAQQQTAPAPRVIEHEEVSAQIEPVASPPAVVADGEHHPAPAKARAASSEARMLRVQAEKLDRLIDLVGELVIAGASATELARQSGATQLVEATSLLSRLVEDIRDSALQLRMVQIGETFNRFNRVVRDVSHELGKDIGLVIRGGETELDKSLIEKVGDPLMHLVRNAMDHGIESQEKRQAAGKPARGRIELNAYHDSSSVVIEVSDDGGGLPYDKILAKAVAQGLVPANQSLTDEEIAALIFRPGFSTADRVSNLSGRGVGLDVVARNIQALRGTVEIKSKPGQGSRFVIRLPLTLAIIDGFLTAVGKNYFIVPLDTVVECIELPTHCDREYLNLRGEVLPFLRLRDEFELEGEPSTRQSVVVVQYAGHKVGLVVDRLHGEFQTVIKPLGPLFRHLRGIGGSTILGSGEVGLILDVPLLARRASRREARSFEPAPRAHKH
ncbi:chemotaxis protein CheA [Rivihabitans pingtungensis]|uniref:Chemotaxis protein CheA n=1 Tax=Rivihabitans pingtungensis TaxID=1054498 RepID=A0A318KS67_9NEIS|nr:chemotaxis protein CheA [Rivihabitans pingtungensis]PXX79452.1 two-component system chemotaxis sensor kinase CheA [Rivihabitans pingtungensis]